MANQEHVDVVLQGADAIMAWRQAHRGETLDLSGANLSGANLRDANLTGANLSAANLSDADLSDAYLSDANLRDANLRDADLRDADLSGANLSEANLSGANLSGAVLSRANLSAADLSEANLSDADLSAANLIETIFRTVSLTGSRFDNARLASAVFHDLDLSEVQGLDTVVHHGPSALSVSTLFKSQGNIPEVFLRGCGVPDALIDYLPSLIQAMEPIEFYSCFISYSSDDEDFVRKLHSCLVDKKLRVWFAPEDMRGGRKTHEQILEAVRLYDKLLVVLSESSMDSEWVRTEIRWARQKELEEKRQVLFPLRLVPIEAIKDWTCFDADTGKDLAVEMREYHMPDFSAWEDNNAFEAAFARLMDELRRESPPVESRTAGPI